MKSLLVLCCILALYIFKVYAQEFNKEINKDSLLKKVIKYVPESRRPEFLKAYNSGSEQAKEGMLFFLSMPRSSKKELIANIKTNSDQINILKNQYAKLVPRNYIISIEFEPENKIVNTKESIDLKITALKNNETTVTQDWQLDPNSNKLKEMLALIGWDKETLKTVKKLLTNAHCISIENGKRTSIGFARSGLGMYSYVLFDRQLRDDQKQEYNDGCSYIFYKKNIVLEYEGGAAGPQCFPDRD